MSWDKEEAKVRVAVLDDHPIVLKGIDLCLSKESGLHITGLFHGSAEFLAHLSQSPADVLLIDYVLGPSDIDGLNLIRLLRTRFGSTQIVVASGLCSPATVRLALRAGASGYVSKEQPMSELPAAILAVANGRRYVSARLDAEIGLGKRGAFNALLGDTSQQKALMSLTSREHEVLRCLLDGDSVSQIATKFSRSIKTISTQKSSAFRKLGLRSHGDLFRLRNDVYDLLREQSTI